MRTTHTGKNLQSQKGIERRFFMTTTKNYNLMCQADYLKECAQIACAMLDCAEVALASPFLLENAQSWLTELENACNEVSADYYDEQTETVSLTYVKRYADALYNTVQEKAHFWALCLKASTLAITCSETNAEKALHMREIWEMMRTLAPMCHALSRMDDLKCTYETQALENAETAYEKARAECSIRIGCPTDSMIENAAENFGLHVHFESSFLYRAKGTERETVAKRLYHLYCEKTLAKLHLYGFTFEGVVYGLYADLPIYTTVKKSSKTECGFALRFIPSKADKKYMLNEGSCFPICAESEMTREDGETQGDAFERIVKKYLGIDTTEKDYTSFFEGCDISCYGLSVKYECATLIHEGHEKRLTTTKET